MRQTPISIPDKARKSSWRTLGERKARSLVPQPYALSGAAYGLRAVSKAKPNTILDETGRDFIRHTLKSPRNELPSTFTPDRSSTFRQFGLMRMGHAS